MEVRKSFSRGKVSDLNKNCEMNVLCTESSIFKVFARSASWGPSSLLQPPQSTLKQNVAHLSQRVKRIQVVEYTMLTYPLKTKNLLASNFLFCPQNYSWSN